MEKANLLTVGRSLANVLMLDGENDFLEQLGKDFCSFIKDKNSRRVLKKLNFDLLGTEILFFALERNDIKNTNMILVRSNKAQFRARIINGELRKNEPFFIQDMFEICNHFLEIDGVESMSVNASRNQLNWILKQINIPVLIQAGYLYYGDYETVDECQESYDLLDKVVDFYKSIGFTDVNKWIGCYDESRIMLKADDEFIKEVIQKYQ